MTTLREAAERDDLIETLRDCANALGELLPRDHAYRKIIDKANRLLDRHEHSHRSSEPLTDDEIRKLWDSHTIEVYGKIGINPVVFARYLERAYGIGEKE